MSDLVSEHPVAKILATHDAFVEGVKRDTRFTDAHKGELINSSYQTARQDAVALAEKQLAESQQAFDAAQAKLDKEERSWRESISVDPTRELVAIHRAEALTYLNDPATANDTLRRFVDDAVRTKDVAALRAFESTAPKLYAKVGEKLGNPPFDRSTIMQLQRQAKEALVSFEPEPLKKSRAALDQAARNDRELKTSLRRINERWSRGGGPGPLRIGSGTRQETYTNEKTGASSTRFVATGGGFFG